MKKDIVGGVPGNVLGMMADLCHKLQHGSLKAGELEKFLKLQNPFEIVSVNFADLIKNLQKFYKKVFGIRADFSNLRVPPKQEGFDRLLVIANLSLEQLYAKCKELFSCWRLTNNDLDKIVTENERMTKNGPYAIWVRDRVEADEELKNLSANDIKAKNLITETLAERLIHELKFFSETRQHLDIQSITLCTGSRYSVGRVPRVGWYDGEMRVYWYNPGFADDILRSRLVVS